MKSSRLFQIVYRLLQDGRLTAPELAAQLEVSKRTVYRDIEALCEAGVPIVTEQGKGGGIRLMENFVFSKALMSEAEQEQLLLAVKSLSSVTQENELITKLGALFQRNGTGWLEVDFSRWGQSGKPDGRFDLIKTAILEKRVLRFQYAAASGVGSRSVRPARLSYKSSAWYLQGFCLDRQDWRTFKLTRISALRLTDERFDETLLPPPIEIVDEPAEWPMIRLRFPPAAAFRVYDEFENVLQETDGSLLVTTRMPLGDGWLYGYLLSFGGAAEVIEPESVRRGLAERARAIWKQYEKNIPQGADLSGDVTFAPVSYTHPREEDEYGQEAIQMEQKFCQSCGMPMDGAPVEESQDSRYGREKDGSLSHDYCAYCYKDGAFTRDCTMEEMIDFCVPFVVESNAGMTEDKAREMMRAFFPKLKRWARA